MLGFGLGVAVGVGDGFLVVGVARPVGFGDGVAGADVATGALVLGVGFFKDDDELFEDFFVGFNELFVGFVVLSEGTEDVGVVRLTDGFSLDCPDGCIKNTSTEPATKVNTPAAAMTLGKTRPLCCGWKAIRNFLGCVGIEG
jgi:hypothetical protein